MFTTQSAPSVFTFQHHYRAFVAAIRHGERCEIDEAMFIHWLETESPICMLRDVILADNREIRADFVARSQSGDNCLLAFWCRFEERNPTDRRFYAQRGMCLV